jgi:hypothetical protein
MKNSFILFGFSVVVAPVGQKIVCGYSFDEAASLRAIRSGTRRNKNSDWHTMRIHGQMYLGVEPPLSGSWLGCRLDPLPRGKSEAFLGEACDVAENDRHQRVE